MHNRYSFLLVLPTCSCKLRDWFRHIKTIATKIINIWIWCFNVSVSHIHYNSLFHAGKGFTKRSAKWLRSTAHFFPYLFSQFGTTPLDNESAEVFAIPWIWRGRILRQNLCLYNSTPESIRKPMPAEHLLFLSHATASVLSQFNMTSWDRHNGEKHTIPISAAKSSRYAIGSLWRGICMVCLLEQQRNNSWSRPNAWFWIEKKLSPNRPPIPHEVEASTKISFFAYGRFPRT